MKYFIFTIILFFSMFGYAQNNTSISTKPELKSSSSTASSRISIKTSRQHNNEPALVSMSTNTKNEEVTPIQKTNLKSSAVILSKAIRKRDTL